MIERIKIIQLLNVKIQRIIKKLTNYWNIYKKKEKTWQVNYSKKINT